jgi:hypothetical protein
MNPRKCRPSTGQISIKKGLPDFLPLTNRRVKAVVQTRQGTCNEAVLMMFSFVVPDKPGRAGTRQCLGYWGYPLVLLWRGVKPELKPLLPTITGVV